MVTGAHRAGLHAERHEALRVAGHVHLRHDADPAPRGRAHLSHTAQLAGGGRSREARSTRTAREGDGCTESKRSLDDGYWMDFA